ncbi:histone-lysine N-methyltransferase SETMAR-like [Rhynchophorus ferrugineus]|uniref:histone-lysine N-methyltransferase SETMAR-like n=1 Tax=Rhynchophorus ferrugineus TaxID=354439 RepID=UPI003FCC2B0E
MSGKADKSVMKNIPDKRKKRLGKNNKAPIIKKPKSCINKLVKSRDFPAIFLYEYKLGHNIEEAMSNIVCAFGEDSVDKGTLQKWYKKFEIGDTNLDDEELNPGSNLVDDENWKALIDVNPQSSIPELAKAFGLGDELQNYLESSSNSTITE